MKVTIKRFFLSLMFSVRLLFLLLYSRHLILVHSCEGSLKMEANPVKLKRKSALKKHASKYISKLARLYPYYVSPVTPVLCS